MATEAQLDYWVKRAQDAEKQLYVLREKYRNILLASNHAAHALRSAALNPAHYDEDNSYYEKCADDIYKAAYDNRQTDENGVKIK